MDGGREGNKCELSENEKQNSKKRENFYVQV